MKELRTIDDIKGKLEESDKNFSFQKQLTGKLDKELPFKQFNQQLINEIVLWKVNRYVKLDD